jgi:hypothetical protein
MISTRINARVAARTAGSKRWLPRAGLLVVRTKRSTARSCRTAGRLLIVDDACQSDGWLRTRFGALAPGSEVCGHDRDGCTTVDPGSGAGEDGADADLSPVSAEEDGSVLGTLQPRNHRTGRVRLAR